MNSINFKIENREFTLTLCPDVSDILKTNVYRYDSRADPFTLVYFRSKHGGGRVLRIAVEYRPSYGPFMTTRNMSVTVDAGATDNELVAKFRADLVKLRAALGDKIHLTL